jgi:hypothetical protein
MSGNSGESVRAYILGVLLGLGFIALVWWGSTPATIRRYTLTFVDDKSQVSFLATSISTKEGCSELRRGEANLVKGTVVAVVCTPHVVVMEEPPEVAPIPPPPPPPVVEPLPVPSHSSRSA